MKDYTREDGNRIWKVGSFLKAVGSYEGGAAEEGCACLPGPSRRL